MSAYEASVLVKPLAEALKTEFPFFLGLGISAEDESWEKAAQGILIKLGAEAHPHFEEHAAPGMLSFTFKDVPQHDPSTGKVIT